MLQLLEDFVLQTLYRGSASGPRWRTPIHQNPCGFAPIQPPSAAFGLITVKDLVVVNLFHILCARMHRWSQNIWRRARRRPWLTPEKHSTLHVCCHIKCQLSNRLGCVGGPKYFWDSGAPPLGMGRGRDPLKHATLSHALPYQISSLITARIKRLHMS